MVSDRIAARILEALARWWPSPVAARTRRLGGIPGSNEHAQNYTVDQFMSRVWFGVRAGRAMPPLWGKRVLEIGCGHGGITCYLASIGATPAVGIDLDPSRFEHGAALAGAIESASGGRHKLTVTFAVMDCHDLAFADASFDVVMADNLMEHVTDPKRVMLEAFRVLTANGILVVPTFSSILSKHGLHVKHGLKVPWANLFFNERTIVEVVRRRARRHPELRDVYPGLHGDPQRVRDLRKHRDLNDITHANFLSLAGAAGFLVDEFRIDMTKVGRVLAAVVPAVRQTRLLDVMSVGAGAVLRKPSVGRRGSSDEAAVPERTAPQLPGCVVPEDRSDGKRPGRGVPR